MTNYPIRGIILLYEYYEEYEMEVELINKMSDLTFGCYFNESLDMIVTHFFNKDIDKPDLIAYLKHDMSWDVREIVDEVSELDDYDGIHGETITITHEQLGIYDKNSSFSSFMKKSIQQMSENEGVVAISERIMEVLENNSYDKEEE